jgi:hypothetical protein
MGNCIPKQNKNKKEEESFLLDDSDSDCRLTVASSISITLSDSISLPPTPPPTPPTTPRTPPPTPQTSPQTPPIVMSIPVQKKEVLSELVQRVPEIKANFRWKKLHQSQFKKVCSPQKHRFDQVKYVEHMMKSNVCQLCETLFPDETYLKTLGEDHDSAIKYCFVCQKFILGRK